MTTSLQERITLTTIIVASFFSLAAALTLAGLFGVFDQTQFDRAFEVFSECAGSSPRRPSSTGSARGTGPNRFRRAEAARASVAA